MRIVFLPDWATILLFFVVWALIQVGAALLCLVLPDKFFQSNKGIFKTRKFEKDGQFYQTFFKIKKWKHLLPDGAKMVKIGYAKKTLTDYSTANLNKFLVESCRAELTHLLPIGLFWVFFFFTTPLITLFMFGYSLLVNLPCLFAQRYNRPRIQKLLTSKQKSS